MLVVEETGRQALLSSKNVIEVVVVTLFIEVRTTRLVLRNWLKKFIETRETYSKKYAALVESRALKTSRLKRDH